MSSPAGNNKQATLQLVASVVVAGLIVIGISTLSGYLPTGTPQTTQPPQSYEYITTTCGASGCVNVVVTATYGSTSTGGGNLTATTTGSSGISGFHISGTPSASLASVVMANGPVILVVAAAVGAGLLVGVVRKKKRRR